MIRRQPHLDQGSQRASESSNTTLRTMKDKGYLQFTHPIVYSANYAHASYPEVPFGGVEVSPCDGGGYLDELKGGGPVWQTWRGGLRDAADQAWSGFGGAGEAVSPCWMLRSVGGLWVQASRCGRYANPVYPGWR